MAQGRMPQGGCATERRVYMLEQAHPQIRRNDTQAPLKHTRSYLVVDPRQTKLRGLAGRAPSDSCPGEHGLHGRVVGVEPQLDCYFWIP